MLTLGGQQHCKSASEQSAEAVPLLLPARLISSSMHFLLSALKIYLMVSARERKDVAALSNITACTVTQEMCFTKCVGQYI